MENQDHVILSNDNHSNITSILKKNYNSFDTLNWNQNLIQIIGKRSTGKTTLAKELINKFIETKNVQKTIIFTQTKNCYKESDNVIVLNDYTVHLEQIIKNQVIDRTPKTLVFDDCFYANSINNNNAIREMLLNGRHYNLYVIIITQYGLGFKPELRCQFDLIFVFRDDYISNIKRLYEYYFGMIPKFKDFNDLIKELQEFECLVVNNTTKTNNLKDIITYYKSTNKIE